MDTDNTTPATDDNQTSGTGSEVELLQQQLAEMTATAKRALADLQNVQRRASEERIQLYPQAQADLMVEFLAVVDNFGRAFSAIPQELQSNDWVQGVIAIEQQFVGMLNKVGLEQINPEGQAFDPNQHEAMVEAEGPAGQVIQVLEKGYKFKDKVIRPAKVSVGK